MFRKIIIIVIFAVILSACSGQPDAELRPFPEESDRDDGTAEKELVELPVQEKQPEIQKMVTDLTGEEHMLKIADDLSRVPYSDWFYAVAEYSQVSEGHYYYMRIESDYMRMGSDWCYSIYRDRGELVGQFLLSESERPLLCGCVRYNGEFYVLLSQFKGGFEFYKLAKVDFQGKSVQVFWENKPRDFDVFPLVAFHHDKIYMQFDKVEVLDLDGKKVKNIDYPHSDILGCYFFKNEMIYLNGSLEDGQIVFYNYDMESDEVGEIFRYKPKKEKGLGELWGCSLQGVSGGDVFFIEGYDKGNILYMIPKDEKKIQKISDSGTGGVAVVHKKYVFYTDMKHKIHRWDRRTGEDKVISSIKAMAVDCTEEGLYVQEYNAAFVDPEQPGIEENSTCSVWFMGFDGENLTEVTY